MKYAITLVLIATMLAFAGGEFSTGGSDLFKFSGYNKFLFGMYGAEDSTSTPDGFSFYNYTAWSPRINDTFSGCMSFDTKFGYSNDFTLKLADIWLKMNITPELSLQGGRFKLPFGYAFYRSGSSLPFYSRALVTGQSEFKNYGARDIGAMLNFNIDPVTLNVAYTNGTDAIADTLTNKQITARLLVNPVDWAGLGAAYAMIGGSRIDTLGNISEWDAAGIDIFAYADYAVSESATINFEGEYFILGYDDTEVEDMENVDGTDYYVSLAGTFGVDMGIITALQPAFRYETFDPPVQIATGADGAEDAETVIDLSLNLRAGSMNNFQVGAQMFFFEDEDIDGYNNIYVNWLLKF